MASSSVDVRVGERTLRLTNLEKVFWPSAGYTKGQMLDYYSRMAPVLIPHLKNRPLTLKRYPDGIEGQMFYEKNCPSHRPDWMGTAKVWSGRNDGYMHYCVVDDLPALVWVAQLGTIELHTSLSFRDDLPRPRAMVFDLDPGPPATIVECCRVAGWLREWFEAHDLQALCKTSGSKGLQMYVPLNTPVSYEQTRLVSKALAQGLERRHPDLVVHVQRRTLREGKVLIDWSQNHEYKTTVNVYSLRARERPTVSTPVDWDEIERCEKKKDPDLLVFTGDDVLERVRKRGDLFEPVLTLEQTLPKEV